MKKSLVLLLVFILPICIFAQNWTIESVDSVPDFVVDCSIVIDNQNYPHIAYCCRHPLGGNLYSYWIKYARWNGISWEFQPVESIAVANIGYLIFTAARLCLDSQDHSHIVYPLNDSNQLKYAYNDGFFWQTSIIDRRYSRNCINIDMTLSEPGVPNISYSFVDSNAYTRGIRYAFKSGDSWIIQTVWEENRIPNSILFTTAIDLDRSGYPVIAFAQWSYSTTDTGYLFCARFTGQNWEIDTVHRMENEMYYVFSLKVDRVNRAHIFYKRDFGVFYAVTKGDSWAIEFVDMNGRFEAAGDMILDGDKPNVVYSSVEDPLIYAYKVDTIWNYEIIDHYNPGLYPSIARDNRGCLHVSYIEGPSFSRLCYARRESPSIAEKGIWSIAKSKTLIEIYPNPAKSFLAIRFSQNPPFNSPFVKGGKGDLIKIFDVSGKMIKEFEILPLHSVQGQNDGVIDVSNISERDKSWSLLFRIGQGDQKVSGCEISREAILQGYPLP